MTANTLIRQAHRWISIAFTAGVVAYIIAMTRGRCRPGSDC